MTTDDIDLIGHARKLIEQNDKVAARALLLQAARRKSTKQEALEILADLSDSTDDRHKYLARLDKARHGESEVQGKINVVAVKAQKPNILKFLWSKKFRLWTVISTLLFVVFPVLWTVFTDVIPSSRTVKKMTGEWNVAVASFTNQDTDLHRSDIILISSIFSNRFAQEMELLSNNANLVVQVWGPQEVDRSISGNRIEERALAAEKLAADLNADLLIYGTIQQTEDGYILQPEFYIRAENYYEADELVGQHRFGGPISIQATQDTFPTQVSLNIELSRRSEVLALVARGLSLYIVHSYDLALDFFSQANQDNLWVDPSGREFIYLFQGNAAIRSIQFDQARENYTHAIQLEPQYGRGYVGLGNVTYSLAVESASNYTFAPDQEGLLEAKAFFEQALQAEIQPPSAELPSRVAFGIGQIYMVQWFTGQETHDLAIEQFNIVLANYNDGQNTRLQELASEAHARLGVIYRQDEQVDAAIAELQQALELSTMPARRGLYWATLSDLYQKKNNEAEAITASQQSINQYKLAITLPVSDDLRAFYWGKIGERYEFLQETEKAIHAYQQALSLLSTDDVDYLTYQRRLESLQP